jgi:hypothetical protein
VDDEGVLAESVDGHVEDRRLAAAPGAREGHHEARSRGGQEVLSQVLGKRSPPHGVLPARVDRPVGCGLIRPRLGSGLPRSRRRLPVECTEEHANAGNGLAAEAVA